MRKILKEIGIISIIFIYCFFAFGYNFVCFADDELEEDDGDNEWINETIQTSADITNEPKTYSKYIVCIERTTNQVLYEKDAYTKTPMASTTKIMTAMIAIENCDLSEEVEISSKAAGTGGSTLGIYSETKMTIEALLYGLLLRSRK